MGDDHPLHRLDYHTPLPPEEHVFIWFLKMLIGYIVICAMSGIAAVLIFAAITLVARTFGT